MEDVIQLLLHNQLRSSSDGIRRQKPNHCKYPILGRPWEVQQIPRGILSRQRRKLMGTHLQLIEIESISPTSIQLLVSRANIFMFLLLQGEISLRSQEQEQIAAADQPSYQLSYLPHAHYDLHIPAGSHALLIITLDTGWPISLQESYKEFVPLQMTRESKTPKPFALPTHPIPKVVWRLLEKLRITIVKQTEDSLQILAHITHILNTYHQNLAQENATPTKGLAADAEELQAYLAQHYMFKEACQLDFISLKLSLSRWRIRQIAKEVFGCSLRQYLNKLRMEKAKQLLLTTDLPLHTICIHIGLSSASTFSNNFQKHTGFRPLHYRRKHRF